MPPVAVDEFQSALTELAARSGEAAGTLVSRLDRLSPPEARAFITDAYPALLAPFLAASGQLTTQWYGEQPAMSKPAGSSLYVPESARVAPPAQLAISGRWALAQSSPTKAIVSTTTRHVQNVSRDTVIVNATREGVRWVRKAQINACGFCKMLATRSSKEFGRGQSTRRSKQRVYSYKSEGVFLDQDTGQYYVGVIGKRGSLRGSRPMRSKYHENCKCIAVPVRDGRYDPPDYVEQWTQEYDAIVDKNGTGDLALISKIMDEGRFRPDRLSKIIPTPAVVAPVVAASVPPPVDLDEPLPSLRRKDDPTYDPVADISAINPNFRTSEEWDINCTRCALASELRHQGYDVTALPKPKSITDNNDQNILAAFKSKTGVVAGTGRSPRGFAVVRWPANADINTNPGQPVGMREMDGSRYFSVLPKGRKAAKDAADQAALEWGDGSRGYVIVSWKGRRSSHIFNVENRGGKIIYTDGQSNEIDASGHWDRISPGANSARIVRVDDMVPNEEQVTKWVRSRTDDDIAAGAARVQQSREKALADAKAKNDAEALAARKKELAAAIRRGPSRSELDAEWDRYVSEMSNYGTVVPASQRADFEAGIKTAKKSDRGIDPDKYSDDPDRNYTYSSGWFYFRSWRSGILNPV
jgi:hypothetical protein